MVMIAVVAPFFFVFFYMAFCAFKPELDLIDPGVWIFKPTLENFRIALFGQPFLLYVLNSFIIASLATLIGLASGVMSAYAIARFNQERMALSILITRMIPYITCLIPFYLLYRQLNLLDTYIGVVFSHLVITVPFSIWIMMGFIEDIPKDLEEAAWMDGCSRIGTFFRIVLPLTISGLVATAILCFIFSWNNFQMAALFGE